MNINEFIDNLSKSNNIKEIIKVSYIPVEDKRNIALEVLDECTVNDGGYVQIDRFKRDICFDIAMLREYTNLHLSYNFESMMAEYDVLCEHNIPFIVFEYIGHDYTDAKKILDYEEQNVLNKNSIEAQLSRLSLSVIGYLKTMNNKLESLNLNDILPAETDMNQVLEMLNKLK